MNPNIALRLCVLERNFKCIFKDCAGFTVGNVSSEHCWEHGTQGQGVLGKLAFLTGG